MKLSTAKPEPRRKLDSLTPDQRRQLLDWLLDRNLKYADIQRLIKTEFGIRVSLAWITRRFQEAHQPKPVTSTLWTVELSVSIKRNGEQLARSGFVIPLRGGKTAFRRAKALRSIVNLLN